MPWSKNKVIAYSIPVGILLGIVFFLFIEVIPTMARNIPTQTPTIDYLKGTLIAFLLFFVIPMLPINKKELLPMLGLWGLRCFITLGFMLIYEHRYGLDAYRYFSQAVDPAFNPAFSFEFMTGTHTMMWLGKQFVTLVPFADSYHAMKVAWSFLGFLGCYFFYAAYTSYTEKPDIKLLVVIQCFPSILFWSSILGKDPISFFGISLFFFGALNSLKEGNFKNTFLILFGLFLAGMIRMWLVALFSLPFAIVYLIRSKANPFVRAGLSAIIAVTFLYFSTTIYESVTEISQGELHDSVNRFSANWTHGGSGQNVEAFTGPVDMLIFMPKGIFTALFRPLPGEVNNIFGILSGLENLFLLSVLFFGFVFGKKTIFKDAFIQLSIATIVIWSSFYGFISYQNLGTAARFKLQVLPIIVIIAYHFIRDVLKSREEY